MKVKSDHHRKFSNFKQLEGRSLKNIRASTGFKPVTSAIPVRCSTNWAVKPWCFSGFFLPIMKVKSDHRSKFSNLSNWKEEAWKISGPQRDSKPWPPRYRCDAWPNELWSPDIFQASSLFKLENLLQWSLFTFIYNCITIWISYVFHRHYYWSVFFVAVN